MTTTISEQAETKNEPLEAGLIAEFNKFFAPDAKAEAEGSGLKITIGSRAMVIAPPRCVGFQSNPTSVAS